MSGEPYLVTDDTLEWTEDEIEYIRAYSERCDGCGHLMAFHTFKCTRCVYCHCDVCSHNFKKRYQE